VGRYGWNKTSNCEAAMLSSSAEEESNSHQPRTAVDRSQRELQRNWRQQLYRAWRMFCRCLKLAVSLAPIAAFYPILLLQNRRDPSVDAQDIVLMTEHGESPQHNAWVEWYLTMCLQCVEASGAAVIKFMQWAGSRPDMFGYEFCSVFSRLQDHTTPHSWEHTEQILIERFGPNWRDKIELDQDNLLGSGCIGQVYRGVVKRPSNNNNLEQHEHVAVKVLHPNVHADIDADLDLMRVAAKLVDRIPGWRDTLKWLDLPNCIEEFAHLLTLQLDLRTEAANLQQFGKNFEAEPDIIFPELVDGFEPSKDILVESYVEGIPVLKFARENRDDRQMLSDMCFKAIRCVCKMIFLDNFIHGDLHPGNVFVSPDGKNFILLDVGIVAEYSENDHQTIVDILSSFIRRNGRKAGQCMISDSNRRRGVDYAVNEELFLDKIEALTWKAADKDNHLMEHLGAYITQICNAAATHHIMMNPSFVSAALAVKVQEGIALALDPQLEMWKVATPIIVESERRRKGLVKSAAKHILGYEKWVRDLMSNETNVRNGRYTQMSPKEGER